MDYSMKPIFASEISYRYNRNKHNRLIIEFIHVLVTTPLVVLNQHSLQYSYKHSPYPTKSIEQITICTSIVSIRHILCVFSYINKINVLNLCC